MGGQLVSNNSRGCVESFCHVLSKHWISEIPEQEIVNEPYYQFKRGENTYIQNRATKEVFAFTNRDGIVAMQFKNALVQIGTLIPLTVREIVKGIVGEVATVKTLETVYLAHWDEFNLLQGAKKAELRYEKKEPNAFRFMKGHVVDLLPTMNGHCMQIARDLKATAGSIGIAFYSLYNPIASLSAAEWNRSVNRLSTEAPKAKDWKTYLKSIFVDRTASLYQTNKIHEAAAAR